MMGKVRCAILGCLVAVLVLREASALQCYSCNTAHSGCADPFNSTNIAVVNCSELYYSSRTNELGIRATSLDAITDDYARASSTDQYECHAYHITFISNNTEVVRGCRVVDANNLCTTLTSNAAGAYNVSSCYTCSSDLCNSSPGTQGVAALALACLTVAAFFRSYY